MFNRFSTSHQIFHMEMVSISFVLFNLKLNYFLDEICAGDLPPQPDKPVHVIVPSAIGGGVFLAIIIVATVYLCYIKRKNKDAYDRVTARNVE